jgi:hypothetical protein
VTISKGTQKTLATHWLLKTLELQASHWPQHLVAVTSPARATAHPWSLLATCTQPRVLYYLRQSPNTSNKLIFHPETLPQRRGFTTHRRAHMRTCSLYRRAYVRAYFSHRRAHERTCSPYRHALGRACHTHRCARKRACSPHRRALMRACIPHSARP